jgi:hypothetical protein
MAVRMVSLLVDQQATPYGPRQQSGHDLNGKIGTARLFRPAVSPLMNVRLDLAVVEDPSFAQDMA